jgi:glutathione S-transferase
MAQLAQDQAMEKTAKRRARTRRLARPAGPSKKGQPRIELFQRESCPFSHAVRAKLTDLGMDFIAHTVPEHDALKHRQLVDAGGKDQIPFLIDHATGVHLYDSGVIRIYLENEYGSPAPGQLSRAFHRVDEELRARVEQIRWALQAPGDRFRRLSGELRDGIETLQGTIRYIRQRLKTQTPGPTERDAELA